MRVIFSKANHAKDFTWTGRWILDMTVLPDSVSSWISSSSQVVAVISTEPAVAACRELAKSFTKD